MRQSVTLYPPGTSIDHFKIMRFIGRGGMGEVYLARDTELGRKVALKLLHPRRCLSAKARKRFLHEARATARFNHPHIITIHAAGEHQGRPYVALEYLEGEDLRQRLQQERPSTKESLRIALTVAEALEEAHSHKLLHRDLKPSNIFLPKDGRLRVLDFGLATPIAPPTQDNESQEREVHPESAGISQQSPAKEQLLAFDTHTAAATASRAAASLAHSEAALLQTETPLHHPGEGTPGYMAPEQWESAPNTEATDIWGIGVLLYELMTGTRPYRELGQDRETLRNLVTAQTEVPWHEGLDALEPALQALIRDCLAKAPSQRPSTSDVRKQLAQALHGRPSTQHGASTSPFRGLLPFRERHANLFFGRDSEIDAFLEELRDIPVLPIVGPSGAGKSSFLQAGVLPRLREQGDWQILWMRPGHRPFANLASCLLAGERSQETSATTAPPPGLHRSANAHDTHDSPESSTSSTTSIELSGQEESDALAAKLQEAPATLFRALHQRAEAQGAKVLLVVDQLEELFKMVEEERTQVQFLESLCLAADDAQDPVRIAFTLRDDFLQRLHVSPEVSRACQHVQVLREPDAESITQMLQKPLSLVGYEMDDPRLIEALVDDALAQSTSLPLLQFTAKQLWERRDQRAQVIRYSDYVTLGGVGGALARHADGLLAQLPAIHVQLVQRLMLRLITPEQTRQVQSPEALLDGLAPQAADVLEQLVQARLLVSRKGRRGRNAEIELAHEALIRCWGQLQRWLEESHTERQFVAEVEQAAALWERRGARKEELWRGAALADAEHRVASLSLPLSTPAARFLEAAKGQAEAHRKRRLQWSLFGACSLLAIAVGALFVAFAFSQAKSRAEKQRKLARLRLSAALIEESKVYKRSDTYRSRARLRQALEIKDSLGARFQWWLHQQAPFYGDVQVGVAMYDIALSPDNRYAAIVGQASTIFLLDLLTLELKTIRGPTHVIYRVAFSRDGRFLFAGGRSGRISLYDRVTKAYRSWPAHKGKITSLVLDAKGDLLASASSAGPVKIWRWRTQSLRYRVQHPSAGADSLLFLPHKRTLISAGGEWLVAWTLGSKTPQQRWRQHLRGAKVAAMVYHPTRHVIIAAHSDKRIRLWEPTKGKLEQAFPPAAKRIFDLALHPDGDRLVTGGKAKHIQLWSIKRAKLVQRLPRTFGNATAVQVTANGRFVLSVSWSGKAQIFDLITKARPRQQYVPDAPGNGIAFSPDGNTLVQSSWDSAVYVWHRQRGQLPLRLKGHRDGVMAVSYHPKGTHFATASQDSTVGVWDAKTKRMLHKLTGHKGGVRHLRFSPDGRWLASAGFDRVIRLWDTQTWRLDRSLRGHKGRVWSVSWHPDGRALASSSRDNTIKLWDVTTQKVVRTIRTLHRSPFRVSFSADGSLLAGTIRAGTIALWDTQTWKQRILGRIPGNIYEVALHPKGKLLASGGNIGVDLWDLTTGKRTALLRSSKDINTVAFSPSGAYLAATGDQGLQRIWHTRTRYPLWRGPLLQRKPPRLLTQAGWQRLSQPALPTPATAPWTRALQQHARYALPAPHHKHLCVHRLDGCVAIWSRAESKRVSLHCPTGLQEVLPTVSGCLFRAQNHLFSLTRKDRAPRKLGLSKVRFVTHDQGPLLASTGGRLYILGTRAPHPMQKSSPLPPGVTAATRYKRGFLLGFDDGVIRWQAPPGASARGLSFFRSYTRPIVRLQRGPKQLLVVQYVGGFVELRSLETGKRLYGQRYHGTPFHIAFVGHQLLVASKRGHGAALDLSAILAPRCQIMREVWREVPTIWDKIALRLKPIPAHHPCAPARPQQHNPFAPQHQHR